MLGWGRTRCCDYRRGVTSRPVTQECPMCPRTQHRCRRRLDGRSLRAVNERKTCQTPPRPPHTHRPVNNVLTPASFPAVCSPPSVYATLHRLKAARGIRLIITSPEILHFIGDKCCEQIYKEIAAVIGGRDQTRCSRDQVHLLNLHVASSFLSPVASGTTVTLRDLGRENRLD